jgi:hypothetical protein
LEFLRLLDGRSADKFEKIEFWSSNLEKVWESSIKSSQRRFFITRIPFSPDVFEQIQAFGADFSYEDTLCNKKYQLKDGVYSVDQEKNHMFRAIVVEPDKNERVILLTNISKEQLSGAEILEAYLQDKVFVSSLTGKPEEKMVVSHVSVGKLCIKSIINNKSSELLSILINIFKCFEKQAQQFLFSMHADDQILQSIYSVPARIRYQKNYVYVRYEIEPGVTGCSLLQRAVDSANGLCMKDYSGRRICFSIFSPSAK